MQTGAVADDVSARGLLSFVFFILLPVRSSCIVYRNNALELTYITRLPLHRLKLSATLCFNTHARTCARHARGAWRQPTFIVPRRCFLFFFPYINYSPPPFRYRSRHARSKFRNTWKYVLVIFNRYAFGNARLIITDSTDTSHPRRENGFRLDDAVWEKCVRIVS